MTNEKGRGVGGVEARAAGQDAWSLEGETLSRRVPQFATFVEATEGGEDALTDAQREFLDKFSSGLEEAISEDADEAVAKGNGDGEPA